MKSRSGLLAMIAEVARQGFRRNFDGYVKDCCFRSIQHVKTDEQYKQRNRNSKNESKGNTRN